MINYRKHSPFSDDRKPIPFIALFGLCFALKTYQGRRSGGSNELSTVISWDKLHPLVQADATYFFSESHVQQWVMCGLKQCGVADIYNQEIDK